MDKIKEHKRLLSFDIAKAICIVLVVVGHYYPAESPEWYHALNRLIYSFHMPLFMFVSGFIYFTFKRDNESYFAFLKKKAKRLLVPYFVVSGIIISIKLFTQGNAYVENPVSVYSYIKMFYLPEAGYFLWFVLALWWMFVLVPLFKNSYSRLFLFVMSIFIHHSSFVSILPRKFCISETFYMLMWFMFGVVVSEYANRLSKVFYSPYVLTVLFVVVFYCVENQYVVFGWGG